VSDHHHQQPTEVKSSFFREYAYLIPESIIKQQNGLCKCFGFEHTRTHVNVCSKNVVSSLNMIGKNKVKLKQFCAKNGSHWNSPCYSLHIFIFTYSLLSPHKYMISCAAIFRMKC
jgi:hypothetical protein